MVMAKGENWNHPRKGSSILTEPLRSVEDIERIKELLKDQPRNLLLFVMGINNGLRCSDILKVKVGQVRH